MAIISIYSRTNPNQVGIRKSMVGATQHDGLKVFDLFNVAYALVQVQSNLQVMNM